MRIPKITPEQLEELAATMPVGKLEQKMGLSTGYIYKLCKAKPEYQTAIDSGRAKLQAAKAEKPPKSSRKKYEPLTDPEIEPADLSEFRQPVLDVLAEGSQEFKDIQQRTEIPVVKLYSVLGDLTKEGVIVRDGNLFTLATAKAAEPAPETEADEPTPRDRVIESLKDIPYQSAAQLGARTLVRMDELADLFNEDPEVSCVECSGNVRVYFLTENAPTRPLFNTGLGYFSETAEPSTKAAPASTRRAPSDIPVAEIEQAAFEGLSIAEAAARFDMKLTTFKNYVCGNGLERFRQAWRAGKARKQAVISAAALNGVAKSDTIAHKIETDRAAAGDYLGATHPDIPVTPEEDEAFSMLPAIDPAEELEPIPAENQLPPVDDETKRNAAKVALMAAGHKIAQEFVKDSRATALETLNAIALSTASPGPIKSLGSVSANAIAQHFSYNVGAAIEVLWLGSDQVEELETAAIYLVREIERLRNVQNN